MLAGRALSPRSAVERSVARCGLALLGMLLLTLTVFPLRSPLNAGSAPSALASPTVPTSRPAATPVPGFGTPTTRDGLMVTLQAATTEAGPNTLTVEIRDRRERPVTNARVTITTRSLEMDMGTYVDRARSVAPGRYAVDTPLGMGGRWQATVEVRRQGHRPVVVEFVVTLRGPV